MEASVITMVRVSLIMKVFLYLLLRLEVILTSLERTYGGKIA